tara:strand:+ start:348 stop:920 length:573 start_codon:yes stop_codon:yes gene_type:complete
MSGYFSDAVIFVIDMALGLYSIVLIIRFYLQFFKANFYNPFSQSIVRFTNIPLLSMRRIIPDIGPVNLSAIILLIALEALRFILTYLVLGKFPSILGVTVLSFGEVIKSLVQVILFCVFLRALLSWFTSSANQFLNQILISFTDPVLKPIRKLLPAGLGIDFSPIAAFIIYTIIIKIIVQPILDLGRLML